MTTQPKISIRTTGARILDSGVSDDRVLVVKSYPEAARARAAAESAWLRAAKAVAGVVKFVEAGDLEVTTVHAGRSTLRSKPPEPLAAAEVLSQVAMTIADLEKRDLRHGQISADHVIVGASGALLCSPFPERDPSGSDLVGLGRCCEELVEGWQRSALEVSNLAQWQQLTSRLLSADESLSPPRAAAALLALGRSAKQQSRWGPRSRGFRRILVGLGVSSIGVTATAMLSAVVGPPSPTAAGPELLVGDKLFMVGELAGEAKLLEPRCEGQAAVVLLHGDGLVWTFSSAVAGARGTARAQVPGATELSVRTIQGCAAAWALGPAGEVRLDLD